jgi:hypothetical protein
MTEFSDQVFRFHDMQGAGLGYCRSIPDGLASQTT